MAWPTSSFPASIDSITRKTDTTDEIVADDHNGAYDCIEHLEAKVGVDGSAVTTSLDYLLKSTSSSNPGHKHTLANGATDVTASAAEVNLIDGSVAGTAVASKALVLGANKNVDTLVIADGGLKLGAGAGTAVTSTAAELNLLDGSTAGTTVASKALVVGANKEVDTLVIADGGLKLGAGAGTAVTSTAAELNILDGVTATKDELNILDGVLATASEINSACDGAASSLGASGYIKTVGGLIIQWGVAAWTSGSLSITWPTTFPTACRGAFCNALVAAAGSGHPTFTAQSTSGGTIEISGVAGSCNVYWLAIGY